MKKIIKIYFIAFFLTIISINANADGVAKVRVCPSNSNQLLYKSYARGWCPWSPAVYKSQMDQGCNYNSYATVSESDRFIQETWNGANGVGFKGGVQRSRCGRGCKQIYNINNTNADSGLESHHINSTGVTMNRLTSTVTIPNITGYFGTTYSDYTTSYSITIWKWTSSTDSIITTGKTKWKGTATLSNGTLTLSGFIAPNFTLNNTDSGYYVVSNAFTVSQFIPGGVDSLEVYIESTADANPQGIITMGLNETSKSINDGSLLYKVYPNPVHDLVNVNFFNKQKGNVEFLLYDFATGRLIKEMGTFPVNSDAISSFSFMLPADLSRGTYLLNAIMNKNTYLIKIIKE